MNPGSALRALRALMDGGWVASVWVTTDGRNEDLLDTERAHYGLTPRGRTRAVNAMGASPSAADRAPAPRIRAAWR